MKKGREKGEKEEKRKEKKKKEKKKKGKKVKRGWRDKKTGNDFYFFPRKPKQVV